MLILVRSAAVQPEPLMIQIFIFKNWWGDMWRQCREDFHGCPSVCARIIWEVLLRFTVNRVIRTTTIKRSTLPSSCVTIHWPVPCVSISIVLSMRTHHRVVLLKLPLNRVNTHNNNKRSTPVSSCYTLTRPLCVHVCKHYISPHL